MRHSHRPGRVVAAVVMLAVLTGCVIEPDGEPAPAGTGDYQSVPLQVEQRQGQVLALVPVMISGEGPFRFALDTGASSTVIAADLADDLGLPLTGEERQVFGVVGVDVVEVVEVEEWSLGDLSLSPGEITMIDMPEPPTGEGLQGLLGSDVLSDFGRVVVDYDRERLELPPSD